jgi:hypothetical protein
MRDSEIISVTKFGTASMMGQGLVPACATNSCELADLMELQAWNKLAWLQLGKKLEPALVFSFQVMF